jgi:hypothetical protein
MSRSLFRWFINVKRWGQLKIAERREESEVMKLLLWVVFGLAVAGLALWMVTTPGVPRNPILILLFVATFAVSPIGTFWMLYVVVRNEKHPLPMILLAFVPYASLWYYFERVHNRRTIES